MKKILCLIFLFLSVIAQATTYYVSTTGSNANNGTSTATPWLTWQYGWSHLHAGDILYIRGGRYTDIYGSTGSNKFGVLIDPTGRGIGYTGTSGAHITVSAYPGEVPILDCTLCNTTSGQNIGIGLYNVSYWDFVGLWVENDTQHQSLYAYDAQSWYLSNVYYITHTACTVHHCGDGFSVHDGYNYIYYTNCDVYEIADTYPDPSGALPGSLANGYYCAPSPTSHVYYSGCRAWNCSDDGWDEFGGSGYIEITNCWSFNNGWCPAGGPISNTVGDGSGFKLGPSTTRVSGYMRILKNCIAAGNKGPGIDQNSADSTASPFPLDVRHAIINCISAYNTDQTGSTIKALGFEYYWDKLNRGVIRNCISFANSHPDDLATTTKDHYYTSAVDADFLSVDINQLKGARKSDGSLPDITAFHWAATSTLKAAGTPATAFSNVTANLYDCAGVAYNSTNPSPGLFQYVVSGGTSVPTLTTTALNSPTRNSVWSGGTISSDGGATIILAGVVWSTTSPASLSNAAPSGGVSTDYNSSISYTPNPYVSNIVFLTPGATYSIRAWATNSVGTGYGNEILYTVPLTRPYIVKYNGKLVKYNGKIMKIDQ